MRNISYREPEMSMAARLRQVLEKFIAAAARSVLEKNVAAAAAFFSRTLKNCMNLVEFQCLQMKHPETESI
jgi:hypothetical protein